MEVTINETQANTIQEKVKTFFDPNNHPAGFCPVKDVVDRIGDKWSLLAILNLGYGGRLRFNQLKTQIEGISQRMLTVTLRSLERDGLVNRYVYAEVPPRVEYELTPMGEKLLVKVWKLADWAIEYKAQILESRAAYDKKAAKKTRS